MEAYGNIFRGPLLAYVMDGQMVYPEQGNKYLIGVKDSTVYREANNILSELLNKFGLSLN